MGSRSHNDVYEQERADLGDEQFVVGTAERGRGPRGWRQWLLEDVGRGKVGGTKMGLERGRREVCLACWYIVFCDGLGRGAQKGMVQLLTVNFLCYIRFLIR